jgi:hypothetical protein
VIEADNTSPAADVPYLYFPPCDNGRQVQIDGTYTPAGTNSPVTVDQLVTIEPAVGTSSKFSTAVAVLPTSVTGVANENFTVTGASLTVRAIWREQSFWRHQDVTTVDIPTSPAV